MLPGVGVAVAELSHAVSAASIMIPMKISVHHFRVIYGLTSISMVNPPPPCSSTLLLVV